MNLTSIWKEYVASTGVERYHAFSLLLNMASSDICDDTCIGFLLTQLDTSSESETLTILHIFSKQALFQSEYLTPSIIVPLFKEVMHFKPIYVKQLFECIPGFVAHDECGHAVIEFVIDQMKIYASDDSLRSSIIDSAHKICRFHPTAKGVEKLKAKLKD